jgi:hypothetical protein
MRITNCISGDREKIFHIIFGTSSCFELWWFELMVINAVFKFRPIEV